VEDDFCHKLERLSVQAGKLDKILSAHVQRICDVRDDVKLAWLVRVLDYLSRGRWFDYSKNSPNWELKSTFEHIELPAKVLDYFLRRDKGTSINQAHDTLIQSYYQQKGSSGAHATTSMENLREQLYVSTSIRMVQYFWSLQGIYQLESKSNSAIAVVITTKLHTGIQSWSPFLSEEQRQKWKI